MKYLELKGQLLSKKVPREVQMKELYPVSSFVSVDL